MVWCSWFESWCSKSQHYYTQSLTAPTLLSAAPLRHLAVRERNHVCWLSDVLSLWRSTFLPLDLSWFKAVLTDDPLLCNLVVHPSILLSLWPIFRLKPHVHKGSACAACMSSSALYTKRSSAGRVQRRRRAEHSFTLLGHRRGTFWCHDCLRVTLSDHHSLFLLTK